MQHSYSSSLRQQEYEILPKLCIKSKVNWKRAAKLVTSPSNESRGRPTYRLVWRLCVRCARASVYVLVHACSFLLSAQKYTLIIICDVTYGGHDLKQYKCTFVRTYTDTHLQLFASNVPIQAKLLCVRACVSVFFSRVFFIEQIVLRYAYVYTLCQPHANSILIRRFCLFASVVNLIFNSFGI